MICRPKMVVWSGAVIHPSMILFHSFWRKCISSHFLITLAAATQLSLFDCNVCLHYQLWTVCTLTQEQIPWDVRNGVSFLDKMNNVAFYELHFFHATCTYRQTFEIFRLTASILKVCIEATELTLQSNSQRLIHRIQLLNFAYKRLLNKPYENEVTLTGQNPPLKCYQPLELFTQLKRGLDF